MTTLTRRLPALLTLGLFAAACGGTSGGTSGKPALQVGLISPLSGQYAPIGADLKAAVTSEADLINKSGGVMGRQIKVQVVDSASAPEQGVLAAKQLISQNPPPDVMIPDTLSAIAQAAFPITTSNGILTFDSCTAPACSDGKSFPLQFQVALPAAQQVRAVVSGIAQVLKGQTIKVGLMNSNDATGKAAVAAFPAEFAKYPEMSVVGQQLFTVGSSDMTVQLSKLKDAGATVVEYQGGGANDFATFIKGIAALNWSVTVMGSTQAISSQFGAIDAPAAVLARVYVVTLRIGMRSGDAASSVTDPFVKAVAETDPTPSNWLPIVMAHDMLIWWKWAVEKAGTTDARKVAAVLEGVGALPASALPKGLLGLASTGWSASDHSSTNADFSTSFALVQPSKQIDGTFRGAPLTLGK